MNLDQLLRKNIKSLQPYSSARDEYSGEALIFLDANENPYNQPYNRYPDPLQKVLKEKIAQLKQVKLESIFLGNGSDEPIDLLIRAFCEPGEDNIITIDPTYGMYQVAAAINNVEVIKSPLNGSYELDSTAILKAATNKSKLIFLCSPNNPSGNSLQTDSMLAVINNFNGIVVVDEAYIDFAADKSLLPLLGKYSNLVILQTFSKAWGMAGIRLGMAFAAPEIISILNKIKYPYNLNILTQQKALELIENRSQTEEWVKQIKAERDVLKNELLKFPFTIHIFPSDANFLLVKMHDARGIYDFLKEKGIIVRDRSKVFLCDDSLRITIGTPDENSQLINTLKELI
ncbi:MAG TPA: histidinol-phosphate transaminase [Mariniphaga sp.]|nr:histidinol-phosphate transaminase [Mariniphaga sp.]